MQVYGVDVLVRIVSHLVFIYLTFWGLKAIRLETFFKPQYTTQIRLVLVLLAVAIGFTASSFFLEIIALCKNLFLVGF